MSLNLRYILPRKIAIILHDAIMTYVAVILSFWLRIGNQVFLSEHYSHIYVFAIGVTIFALFIYYLFSLYRSIWRFASIQDLFNILKTVSIVSVGIICFSFYIQYFIPNNLFTSRTIIIIYWFLQIGFLSAPRLLYRNYRDYREKRKIDTVFPAKSALIIGNMIEAETVLRNIERDANLRLKAIGILSNKLVDVGQAIRGVIVLGQFNQFESVVTQLIKRGKEVTELIITPTALSLNDASEVIIGQARAHGMRVRTIRTLLDPLENKTKISLSEIDVEDVLFREERRVDADLIQAWLKDSTILVSGGAGSIGSEIVRRLLRFGASKIILIDYNEDGIYRMQAELINQPVEYKIVDIRDRQTLNQIFQNVQPDMVIHAAALKQVPLLEDNWREAVKTNIFGTVNVLDASIEAGVRTFVSISTDKAVLPISVLGATKRIAELYCLAMGQDTKANRGTRIVSVRFGNVLGTRGSVVPVFRQQIEAGGPVRVTHQNMTRFFMTPSEAADLVLTAAAAGSRLGKGKIKKRAASGVSLFVLDMGQPVRITNLAEMMVRLAGLEPGKDIKIIYTGLRPGERLDELLIAPDEHHMDVGVEGVIGIVSDKIPLTVMKEQFVFLQELLSSGESSKLFDAIKAIEYASRENSFNSLEKEFESSSMNIEENQSRH